MGWFDEQIRQRKESDQDIFEDSIFRMASVVLGKRGAGLLNSERLITKEAIDDILKYYHYKPAEIPDTLTDPDDQLEFCLRPHGLMRRNVKLEDGWYRDRMLEGYSRIRESLGGTGASAAVAKAMIEELEK